jgi:uncharacterized protein with NAD-binding domain and iron-sulfur cluster
MKRVVVIGGGVAGLTAAQELGERGFRVEVLESKALFGGKARSLDVPGTAVDGRRPLPGEHGFRFFPGFYRHIDDTMARIPFGQNPRGVADNMVPAPEALLARANGDELIMPAHVPTSAEEIEKLLDAAFGGSIGFGAMETIYFVRRMITFLTSCEERRLGQFDRVSWWDFIAAEEHSKAYQRFLGQGITRSLVAMRAEISSTRTIAAIYLQMMGNLFSPFEWSDRLLDGPTNDVWIDPWVDYLEQLGVEFKLGTEVTRLECDRERITSIWVKEGASEREVQADYYVLALPVEAMQPLLNDDLLEAAPSLAGIEHLETRWMNGIQYFLDHDVPLVRGHGIFLDSPWAITTISQAQFWEKFDWSDRGDGRVDGIISVCVSDWDTPGHNGKKAKECTAQEIADEVWLQMERHLNDDAMAELDKANVIDWFLDDSIIFEEPDKPVNTAPLLVNVMGTWDLRPHADLGTPNFFIASDYVRTHTDLATMEGACEAGRRAVNGVLRREGRDDFAGVWPLEEWPVFAPAKMIDRQRYAAGKTNLFDNDPEASGG